MYQEKFDSQKTEVTLNQGGMKSKQTMANVREKANSEGLMALGKLFEELGPVGTLLDEVVTVKRYNHVLGQKERG